MAHNLDFLPEHLKEYVTEQDPSLYTPMDHASWRYIMRVSKSFFAKTAHAPYLTGVFMTGIATDRIPLIEEMDSALQKMGWRAVAVNGFIPPSIFMEFQSLKILAIACDMRKIENLGYTPSPDIVHEAAGHAPMIADAGYRKFLEDYGEIARYAILSKDDLDLYDAIYKLSAIKEDPHSTSEQILEAQKNFEKVAAQMGEPSEAALLARMAWWTTEYGLLNDASGKQKIYGAGLLSSVFESFHCLSEEVKKIPFNLETVIATPYDITRPQPQLFVANSFAELSHALKVFSQRMAYRLGGLHGMDTAKKAASTVTVVFDNGIQFSGVVEDFQSSNGQIQSLVLTGSKQVSFEGKVREEVSHHSLGADIYISLFDPAVAALQMSDIQRKLHGSGLTTIDGSRIQGRFKKEVQFEQQARVLILEHVKITASDGTVIFEEHQKNYPLLIVSAVTSVFGGAADRTEFALRHSNRKTKVKLHKSNRTNENSVLNELYDRVRLYRDGRKSQIELLDPVMGELNSNYPNDWLLRLELLELNLLQRKDSLLSARLRKEIIDISQRCPEQKEMILRGLELLS